MNYDDLLGRIKGLEARVTLLEARGGYTTEDKVYLDELTEADVGSLFLVLGADPDDAEFIGHTCTAIEFDKGDRCPMRFWFPDVHGGLYPWLEPDAVLRRI